MMLSMESDFFSNYCLLMLVRYSGGNPCYSFPAHRNGHKTVRQHVICLDPSEKNGKSRILKVSLDYFLRGNDKRLK